MQKRTRRKASEIERLRSKILKVVKKERTINLTDLVRLYGTSIGIRDTPSDKNLAKRQLDTLAGADHISFKRNGRDLVARYLGDPSEGPDPVPAGAVSRPASEDSPPDAAPSAATAAPASGSPTDIDVIKAYAGQVDEFAKALQRQVSTLVRMIEKAGG